MHLFYLLSINGPKYNYLSKDALLRIMFVRGKVSGFSSCVIWKNCNTSFTESFCVHSCKFLYLLIHLFHVVSLHLLRFKCFLISHFALNSLCASIYECPCPSFVKTPNQWSSAFLFQATSCPRRRSFPMVLLQNNTSGQKYSKVLDIRPCFY